MALQFQESNQRMLTMKMSPQQNKKRERFVFRSYRDIIEGNRDKEEVERESMGLVSDTGTKEEKIQIMKVSIKGNDRILRDKDLIGFW